MYPYPTVAASNPRSAYSRPETVSAMHPSPKSASRREFGTLRPRKGTLKVYNHVSFRNLFDFAKHRSPLPATSIPACPGTLRGGKFFSFASFSAFSEDPATTRVPGDDASVRSFHGSSTPPRHSTPATRRPKAHAEDRRRIAR